MIRSLNTGVLGIRNFQTALDAIGNNLANINTVGFKSARVDFSSTLAQTLRAPTPDTTSVSGRAGMQLGNGVQVAAIKNQFTQGAIKQTGVKTDMAITGDGFFLVKDPTTSELYGTRAGDFREDKNQFLVTNDGYRVQGLHKLAPAYTASEQAEIGDLKLDVGKYTTDRTGLTIGAHDRLFKANHGYSTGNQVKFSGTVPALTSGTITDSTAYFVSRVDDNYFSLHTSAANAASGANAINFANATTGISIAGSSIASVSVPVLSTNATGNVTSVTTVAGHAIANGSSAVTKNSHGYTLGQAVKFNSSAPGGANTTNTYYVGAVAANTFTLHTSKSNATNNTSPIVFSSTANYSLDTGTSFAKTGHGYTTGTSVKFNGTPPGGLDASTVYFVRATNANSFTLHLSPENATANTGAQSYANAGSFALDSGVALIKSGHGLTNGATVRFNTTAPGGGNTTTTYYVRSLSASAFSLHPDATDATNNANVQSFSSGGTFNLNKGSVLSKAGHGLTTGEQVNFTGTAPGGTTSAATYYVNATDANNFTVHGSTSDATSANNPVVFNTTGATYSVDGNVGGTPSYTLVGGASISSYSVGADGKVNMLLTDGTQYVRGQMMLQNFKNPQALMKQGANLFTNLATAGPIGSTGLSAGATDILKNSKAPGSSGVGRIAAGALELANVDMAREFSNMITTQRAFQANARVVTTSDEILKEMMALKR